MTQPSRHITKFTALAGLLMIAAIGNAQPADPFATVTDPFGGTADPFASAADPFEAPPAPAGDPFAPAPSSAPLPAADPFASAGPAADPFATTAPAADPFGAAPAADPFGTAPAADPFGAATTADPFGAAPAADPFGAATTAAPTDDPFGASPMVDPFGGSVSADPFGTGIGGAPLPSDQVNPNGISQLYDFRYERVPTWDGRKVVARRRLTRDDAVAYDAARIAEFREQAVGGSLTGYTPTDDPNAWAEWTYFAEQLQMWSEYVDQIVLGGGDPSGMTAWDEIKWPGAPAAPASNETASRDASTGGKGGSPNIYNENRSLDDQVGDFNPFADFGTGQGGGFPPDALTNQVITAYGNKRTILRELEANQEQTMAELEARIEERKARRLAYNDWREDQQKQIMEFVQDWNRRYNGEVAMIGGVRYELYRPGNVPTNVHRDATVIITDYRLTPYDILNPEDGTLRTQTRN